MPEPHATTATAAAVGTGSAALAGSIFGLAFDALLGGLLGGLMSLMYQAPMPAARMAGSIGAAALSGGAFGPVTVAAGTHYLPWLAVLGEAPLRMAAAIAVGLLAQTAIPAALAMIRRRGEMTT